MTVEQDKLELHDLVLRYARACDNCDGEEFARLFAADGEMVMAGQTITGRDAIVEIAPMTLKKMYFRTMHLVHNDLAWVEGETARGETYCVAHHLTKNEDDTATDLVMCIIYDNEFRKIDGRWQFSRRTLNFKWTQTETVSLPYG